MIFNYSRSGSSTKFEYTGDYTTAEYTQNGVAYTLYTLTSTGTATVKAKSADIWLCGGGSNGLKGSAGGAGAYCASLAAQELEGDYLVTIGAGNGGATSFASLVSANGVANNKSGGSGGGGMGINSSNYKYVTAGSGDGIAKYPFGDSTNFKCPCAGGGGGQNGGYNQGSDNGLWIGGGAGGSNGGNGKNGNTGSAEAGGNYGGGKGGDSTASSTGRAGAGAAATFYGSGGGGGGHWHRVDYIGDWGSEINAAGGAGYQGVVYIRIPA